MKKLGIIGGLGPMATVYFLQLITQMSEARVDQEHMEILLHSKPSIPDRTRFILGLSDENPLKEMIEIGLELKGQGAEAIAIPCITAHYFHNELEEALQMPVLPLPEGQGREDGRDYGHGRNRNQRTFSERIIAVWHSADCSGKRETVICDADHI